MCHTSWDASRERQLADREASLASYASGIVERSAAADEKLAAERRVLAEDRAALQSWENALEATEKRLETRLKAASEWEDNLRAREVAVASGRPPPYHEGAGWRAVLSQTAGPAASTRSQQADFLAEEEDDGPMTQGDALMMNKARRGPTNSRQDGPVARSILVAKPPIKDEEEEVEEEDDDELVDDYEGGDSSDRGSWQAVRDATGRLYYWNPVTGEVSWSSGAQADGNKAKQMGTAASRPTNGTSALASTGHTRRPSKSVVVVAPEETISPEALAMASASCNPFLGLTPGPPSLCLRSPAPP